MSLIQPLPAGPLDIVGDIHGELAALHALLGHLGYDPVHGHPDGRTLVLVGDFVDRGPDSPGVVALVRQLVHAGHARAIAGNHEINLLRHDPKDGAGWYFDARVASDAPKYGTVARATDAAQRQAIEDFVGQLPLALERADLRVVHAAWHAPAIAQARGVALGQARNAYDRWEAEASAEAERRCIAQHMREERHIWPHSLEDGTQRPPFLQAHCDNELNKACLNPLKVLVTGLERRAVAPFFAGNKWRFVQREAWWNDYAEATPVIVGHYWRSTVAEDAADRARATNPEGLFAGIAPYAWHGQHSNVFCVDYSVGARAQAQQQGRAHEHMLLGALRWPERTVVLSDGSVHTTTGFGNRPGATPA